MIQDDQRQKVTQFYDTHPINEKQIIQKLQLQGISIETLTEDILKDYDQDHYGGVEANDILAQKAGIKSTSYVLDVGSGMGGPTRYLAARYGCRVMGLDVTESRYRSALRLAKMVKLNHLVDFHLGNALDMSFADDTFDVVIGQETWAHIPEKARLIAECTRVVKIDGIIAFTDVLRQGVLGHSEMERLQHEMAIPTLETAEGYGQLLTESGCILLEQEDLSGQWAEILTQRLEMYRSLKNQTIEKFGEDHYQKWDDTYSFFVGLFAAEKLGGGRLVARRDSTGSI
ncbi:MAG: methyltransferase domain-containing protein [Desulfobacterales bacterium]|nr:MAG: methyltransferase domain-containing protein [Desulfobacterales bacterium]